MVLELKINEILTLQEQQHFYHVIGLLLQYFLCYMYLSVTIGNYHKSTKSVTEKEDALSEEGTYELLNQEKSAAGLICQLKARDEIPVSHSSLVKDVLGIVATLGKVDDENLGRSVL